MPGATKDFFISYTSADKSWAEWIAWELEQAKFSVVIQAWDFRPGSNFVLEMDRAAREAARSMPILSPSYLDSFFAVRRVVFLVGSGFSSATDFSLTTTASALVAAFLTNGSRLRRKRKPSDDKCERAEN